MSGRDESENRVEGWECLYRAKWSKVVGFMKVSARCAEQCIGCHFGKRGKAVTRNHQFLMDAMSQKKPCSAGFLVEMSVPA